MKKVANIVLLAVLAAGLLSCTKTDRFYGNPQKEIAMNPVMHSMTKAEVPGPVTGSQYPDAEHFGVIAYYSPSFTHRQEWTNTSSVLMYLDGHEFEKEGSTFSGIPKCYWPHQGSLVFAGYSPFDAIKESITFDPNTKALTITGFVSDGKTDLMYFLPELSNYNLVGLNSGASSVTAVFSHALSLVEFNVKGVDNDETVELRSITFNNIPLKGNLIADASGCIWRDLSSPDALQVFLSDEGEVLSSETPVTATSLVIPGSAVDIDLAYDAVGATSHDKTGTITPENAVMEWVAGKKYIYNLTIRSGFIVIESVTTSYIAENESGIGI